MHIHPCVKRVLLFSSMLVLASSLSPFSTHAEDHQPNHSDERQLKGAIIIPPKDRLSDVAPGAVEDTLKACLARIPEKASVGQRMLAELTCQREEEIRQAYQGTRRF
ncbi:MAG: hypothetical protein K0S45_2428 [Nitrospira sp.]|jgi:hypothetical protein|nr:hypothetical protein [Nitrospira sp.]